MPSVWRTVLKKYPMCLEDFQAWGISEWSLFSDGYFDIAAVDNAIEASGNYPGLMTFGDMTEHPDSIVREFGEFRQALGMDYCFGLATALSTLLQHYGVDSPVLDVSNDIDTALFFATHNYSRNQDGSTYNPVGSNEGKSIIYVFQFNQQEMEPIKRDFVIDKLSPVRPERQACVVIQSSPFAVNLPNEFLVGAIRLEGSGPWESDRDMLHLFPDDSEDFFLRTLKTMRVASRHVTDFLRPA